MSVIQAINTGAAQRRTIIDIARDLGPVIAQRASETMDEDQFVAENFALLKSAGLLEAGVPAELGGGGADVDELAAVLQMLGHHCGSTALALSMHTHLVATAAWRWQHQGLTAVEPLLRRVATERIQLVSTEDRTGSRALGKPKKWMEGIASAHERYFRQALPPAIF